MKIDKAEAEALRILFGCNFDHYQYVWRPTTDGHYEVTAVQRVHFRLTEPNGINYFPLNSNTLQVLDTLRDALTVFEVGLERSDLMVDVGGHTHHVNLANEMTIAREFLLNSDSRNYDRHRTVTIRLKVPNDVYAQRILPFQPSTDNLKERNPQKMFQDETFQQIKARLYLPEQLAFIPEFNETLETKGLITALFKAQWVSETARQNPNSFESLLGLVNRASENMHAIELTIFPDEHREIVLRRIVLLQEILRQFHLDEHFRNSGTTSLSTRGDEIDVVSAKRFQLQRVINASSTTSPLTLRLALPSSVYRVIIAPFMALSFDASNEENNQLDALVARHPSLIAGPSTFRGMARGFAMHWYDSDEEADDAAGMLMDDQPVMSFDTRGDSGSVERNRAWFHDQFKEDARKAEALRIEQAKQAALALTEATKANQVTLFKDGRARRAAEGVKAAEKAVVTSVMNAITNLTEIPDMAIAVIKRFDATKMNILRENWSKLTPAAMQVLEQRLPNVYAELTENRATNSNR